MLLRLNIYIIVLVGFIFFGCDRNIKSTKDEKDSVHVIDDKVNGTVPNSLDFVWSPYAFTENEVKQFPDRIEQSLVDYIVQFPNHSELELRSSLSSLIKKSEANTIFFDFLRDKFAFYLYHPNSPFRSELYYEQVLKGYDMSNKLSDTDKVRGKMLLELVSKNKIGTKVADIEFIDKSGLKNKLTSFTAKYKLLIFYDPTCSHCAEVISEMKNSEILNKAIDLREITVIAIDPLGDLKQWKAYQKEIPDVWINGFDESNAIVGRTLFNIQAYPTIYLIDKNNFVVLKDVYFMHVEKYLASL